VAVAEMFRHVPYYWGGKSVQGLDCSGLVQLALEASGVQALRDSDMQESVAGARR
jgi:cell wall-associated NlpC family hydrolase